MKMTVRRCPWLPVVAVAGATGMQCVSCRSDLECQWELPATSGQSPFPPCGHSEDGSTLKPAVQPTRATRPEHKRRIYNADSNRGWRTSRSRARSPPAAPRLISGFRSSPRSFELDFLQPLLVTTLLPFSLPSAMRKPGHWTSADEVKRHARRTGKGKGAPLAARPSDRRERLDRSAGH